MARLCYQLVFWNGDTPNPTRWVDGYEYNGVNKTLKKLCSDSSYGTGILTGNDVNGVARCASIVLKTCEGYTYP